MIIYEKEKSIYGEDMKNRYEIIRLQNRGMWF